VLSDLMRIDCATLSKPENPLGILREIQFLIKQNCYAMRKGL